ncbi:MAG TPA: TSUP family transporter [Chitinophagaceae bacterium]|nr:TSUP family transporter [Chitinophagaceae bacterium]HQX71424.1 TSUP family transporter [Chitinophagaceae bacterium]HQZ72986.1 TSUP family transporter [Chitinophagaceae bacterium]
MLTQQIITALLIGLSAGVLSGLVGVGGGIIMVPALVFFMQYTQHQAQGTSLAVLTLPVVILASIYYYHQCQKLGTPIDLKVVGLLAAGFVIGGFFGGKIALSINQDVLKKIFAIILFYTALKMLNWDTMLVKWLRGIF